MKYEVDYARYREVYNLPYSNNRRYDYSHDWEILELTPDQVRDCIKNCIDIKQIVE